MTAGHDLFGAESREIFEGGFVLVCATTQKVGIEGLPPVNQGLARWDPERYGDLHIACLLYTSPSPRDLSTSRMPSSA